jgi:hypothetical protein
VASRPIDELRKLSLKSRWWCSNSVQRILFLGAMASWPVRVLSPAWREMRRHGRRVARMHGISMGRQLAQVWALAARYRYPPEDYYRYRMYLMPRSEASLFLPVHTNFLLRSLLYGQLMVDPTPLADKRAFYRACREAALPTPETLAEFEHGSVRWWCNSQLPRCDLFSKEAASLCGAGAARWQFDGLEGWKGKDGRVLDEARVVNHLRDLSRSAPLVLQRRLSNHAELQPLGPAGLCTVRVVTLRDRESGGIDVLLAAFRMPTGSEVADNFARGGLASPVDVRTGELGHATYKDLACAYLDMGEHPDTGAVIAGRRLPLWGEVIALALRAHKVFADFPSVGWDVAITVDGPVLLEGNYNWCVVLAQQTGFRGLGATRFAEHYLEWQRVCRRV